MDPLLGRLAARAPRRALIAGGVLAAAVVGGSVVVAGLGASGHESALPPVAVVRSRAPSATPLLVQVSGAVRRPGIVSVPAGARALDAVAAAGGATADADPGGLNLAAPVADGQQITVPARGAAPPSAVPGSASAAGAAAGATVSINSAGAEQLETLPRIGPAMAARIIAWRTAHGGFRSVDDLGQVEGVGPKTLAGLRPHVTL